MAQVDKVSILIVDTAHDGACLITDGVGRD